jgi:hypothetical protein
VKKEPKQKKCEWCNKWFGTIRNGRFCSDLCRSRWHRQTELDYNLKVFKTLRKALEYCTKQHPELLPEVNRIIEGAKLSSSHTTS